MSAKFEGSIYVNGGNCYVSSDERLKTNIKEVPKHIVDEFINNVIPVFYNKVGLDGYEYGYLAQDVLKAGFNELVGHSPNKDMKKINEFDPEDGFQLDMDYARICVLLHKKIQMQQEQIELLISRLTRLERDNYHHL